MKCVQCGGEFLQITGIPICSPECKRKRLAEKERVCLAPDCDEPLENPSGAQLYCSRECAYATCRASSPRNDEHVEPGYKPSEDEIAKATAKIRATWSEREYHRRAGVSTDVGRTFAEVSSGDWSKAMAWMLARK